MALPTFNPSVGPSQDSSDAKQPNVLFVQLGDGYSARAAVGINNNPSKFDWVWGGLTFAQASEVYDFLGARNGVEAFYYTPPFESTPRKFFCRNYSRIYQEAAGFFGMRATFEEVFDLDDPDETIVFDGGFFDPASINANLGTLDGGDFTDGDFGGLPLTIDGGTF
jgi:phage-related protein